MRRVCIHGIRYIQARFRVRRKRKEFLRIRQAKLRPVVTTVASVLGLIPLPEHRYYLVATVIEDETERQCYYYSTDLFHSGEGVDKTFMFGGVSGFSSIVFNLFLAADRLVKESKDVFLGQASLKLENYNIWRVGGTFQLRMHEVEYIPMIEPTTIHPADYSTYLADVTIAFTVLHGTGLGSCCGNAYGSDITELSKILRAIPENSTVYPYTTATGSNVNAKQKAVSLTTPLPMKKMYVSLIQNHLYIHVRWGDKCKIVVNLEEYDSIRIKTGKKIVTFTLKKSGLPVLEYCIDDPHNVLAWTMAMSMINRAGRIKQVMSDVLLLKKSRGIGSKASNKRPI